MEIPARQASSMTTVSFRQPRYSRRELLRMLGVGVVAATLPRLAFADGPTFPEGAVIRTVLKDYAPKDLAGGATLFHEHMSVAPDLLARFIQLLREDNGGTPPPFASLAPVPTRDENLMVDEMSAAKSEGIACIVDGGHPDMGRDINFLKAISTKSGLPIVAGGGFYTQPFYPKEISIWSENQVFDALMKQVDTEPIGAWGEIGSWDLITKDERKVFRAVGRAQAATNMPVFTHTGVPGKSALEQLDLLEDAGANPEHIAIGHLGNLVDPKVEVQKALCRRGCFVGFDRQGGPGDQQQVPMVMGLLEAGFVNNLLFSSDFGFLRDTKHSGGPGYAKTLTVFVPKLKAAGATDEQLHTIMVDNPRRFLAYVPKKPRRG